MEKFPVFVFRFASGTVHTIDDAPNVHAAADRIGFTGGEECIEIAEYWTDGRFGWNI